MVKDFVIEKICRALTDYSMAGCGDNVLVGFSGGKDSVVLLHALNELKGTMGFKLCAIHVNHGIRGGEADGDMEFCRQFCEKRGIPFVLRRVDAVGFSAQRKIGLEEGARELRYKAFAEGLAEAGATKIATAHTASDNAETVIFNLARGCGIEGLRGIPPVRGNIIRPLIYCSTRDILQYADECSLGYVTDSTNADTDYSRNHIRHNVIPLLKKLNPSFETAVTNMTSSVRADAEYIANMAERVTDDSPAGLSGVPQAVFSRWIIKQYRALGGSGQLGAAHVADVASLIKGYAARDCRDTKYMNLPGRVTVTVTPTKVSFGLEGGAVPTALAERRLLMGENPIPETGEMLYVTDNGDDKPCFINIYKKYISVRVKKSIIGDTIIRSRLEGDVFVYSNMTKKVKKMMNEAKIPLEKRGLIPLICDKKGIAWIPGFSVRDDAVPKCGDDIAYIYYFYGEKTV